MLTLIQRRTSNISGLFSSFRHFRMIFTFRWYLFYVNPRTAESSSQALQMRELGIITKQATHHQQIRDSPSKRKGHCIFNDFGFLSIKIFHSNIQFTTTPRISSWTNCPPKCPAILSTGFRSWGTKRPYTSVSVIKVCGRIKLFAWYESHSWPQLDPVIKFSQSSRCPLKLIWVFDSNIKLCY